MPEGSMGPRGYPDWQRVSNYDAEPFAIRIGKEFAERIEVGPIEASRYASMGFRFGVKKKPCTLLAFWGVGPSLAEGVMGTKLFYLDPNIQNPMELVIPNRGPFAWFTLETAVAKEVYEPFLVAYMTNRVQTLETSTGEPWLVKKLNEKLAAKTSVNIYPESYHSGPAFFYLTATTEPMDFRYEVMTTVGTYTIMWAKVVKAAEEFSQVLLLPTGAWRLTVLNNEAAEGLYTVTVMPSMTGGT